MEFSYKFQKYSDKYENCADEIKRSLYKKKMDMYKYQKGGNKETYEKEKNELLEKIKILEKNIDYGTYKMLLDDFRKNVFTGKVLRTGGKSENDWKIANNNYIIYNIATNEFEIVVESRAANLSKQIPFRQLLSWQIYDSQDNDIAHDLRYKEIDIAHDLRCTESDMAYFMYNNIFTRFRHDINDWNGLHSWLFNGDEFITGANNLHVPGKLVGLGLNINYFKSKKELDKFIDKLSKFVKNNKDNIFKSKNEFAAKWRET